MVVLADKLKCIVSRSIRRRSRPRSTPARRILVGDFHTKQTLALLAAIPVAAVLAHFVLDRIDDWTRGREGRDRSPRVICREGAKAVFEPRQGERSSGIR